MNRKDQEEKVIAAVNGTAVLVKDFNTGMYRRITMADTNGPPANIEEYVYNRYCQFCDRQISVKSWPEHIKSLYHQVRLHLNKFVVCYCWIKNINIDIHNPNNCQECTKRYNEQKETDTKMFDPGYYREEDDEEYQEVIKLHQKLDQMTEDEKNKWTCKICDVKCYSEEYYENHLKGKKHREKMKKTKDDKNTNPEMTQQSTQPNMTTRNPNPDMTTRNPNPDMTTRNPNPDMTKQKNQMKEDKKEVRKPGMTTTKLHDNKRI